MNKKKTSELLKLGINYKDIIMMILIRKIFWVIKMRLIHRLLTFYYQKEDKDV